MNFETIRDYCMSLHGVTESFPFDSDTIVWKVAGKMFCLGNISNFNSVNLKCDPERSEELRERHFQIRPGYHMNKKLWNTVELEGLSEKLILELISHSYAEVVRKLPKREQNAL